MVVLVLTLLVVAAAFAIYQWGGNILLRAATPRGHFQATAAGGAPDYTKLDSWISRPGIADDPSHWQPTNDEPYDLKAPAWVFYIHPTTYLERDRWNAPLLPGGQTEFRTRLFVQSQASAFWTVGSVWAPRYRQAAYGTFLLDTGDARQALDLAYSDVAHAFDEFLKHVPASEPIILAAHSQGALHLERLLREKIAGKPIAKRIVAAYVVGWPVSTAADLPALGLPACRSPDQAGCILSWMSFGQPANPDLVLNSYERSAGFLGKTRKREDVLCVNPLTGTQNGSAGPAANEGTLVPSVDMTSANLTRGQVGARCDNGLLLLDGQVPPLGPYVLPGNNYHVYDYALFWGSIRADAMRRFLAWHR